MPSYTEHPIHTNLPPIPTSHTLRILSSIPVLNSWQLHCLITSSFFILYTSHTQSYPVESQRVQSYPEHTQTYPDIPRYRPKIGQTWTNIGIDTKAFVLCYRYWPPKSFRFSLSLSLVFFLCISAVDLPPSLPPLSPSLPPLSLILPVLPYLCIQGWNVRRECWARNGGGSVMCVNLVSVSVSLCISCVGVCLSFCWCVVCCMLYVVCCMLYVVCCMLYVVCCVLYVVFCVFVCCVLYVVCCMLCVVCCMLYVVCCMLYVVCLYVVCCVLYVVCCVLCLSAVLHRL